MNVAKKININVFEMDRRLNPTNNFDIIKRNFVIGNRKVFTYHVDGFLKDNNMQEIMKFLLLIEPQRMENVKTANEFASLFMTYPEMSTQTDFDLIITFVLSGCVAMFIEDIDECIIIDVREYPQRAIQEPEKDKVLRGAKDGFIETPMGNIALIRRRIRNPDLNVEYMSISSQTNNDVVLCYMGSKVNKGLLQKIKNKLSNINPESLTMGSQSLVEALVDKKWYNPFPKARFTERPDVAVSNILEGRIVLIVDNTPSVIILPTYFADFFSEAEDFYFLPPTANFLKILRMFIYTLSIFITPLWLLAVNYSELLPEWLTFVKIQEMNSIPVILQLIMLEFAVEIIRAASINTPSMVSNSISLIGTLIIGDIAMITKIIVPEVMLYTAIVTLSYYSQPSFELGYAGKFMRIILLILVNFFNVFGLIAGILILGLLIITNKTITGESYIYPIYPFDIKAIKTIFFRKKLKSN